MGLMDECISKLGDNPDSENSVFSAICDLFNYLPIAAVIKDSVLCVHSGISEGVNLETINAIKKPYSPDNNKIVADILWAQPSFLKEEYSSNNYSSKYRKLSYSQESFNKFIAENKLSLVVRTKDCINFDKQFNNKLITIFSATNYCGQQNDAAILYVKRNLEIQPKLMTWDDTFNTYNTKKEILVNFPPSPKKN